MQDHRNHVPAAPERVAWNKGKLIGAKPPLRPKHVWSIRTKLQIQGRTRDLAMFNLAIDSKLRGCDVVAIKVEDVAPHGYAVDRATVRQRKTGLPVRFEITEHTRQAVDDYIRTAGRKPGNFLFGSRCGRGGGITARQYARLVAGWIASIGLDPSRFGTHSLRRTKATLIYRRTGNLRCRSAAARNGDILPTNNRLKHASPIGFILASARPCASGGGLSAAVSSSSSCTSPTVRSRACRRG
jgi:integrase